MHRSRPKLTLDTTGLTCPLPALKLKALLSEIEPGDVVTFTSSDPSVLHEIGTLNEIYNTVTLSKNLSNNIVNVVMEKTK